MRSFRRLSTKLVLACLLANFVAFAAQAQTAAQCSGKREGQSRSLKQRAWIEHWPGFAAIRLVSTSESAALFFCGGTVIDKEWILTAAHCFDSLSGSIQRPLHMRAQTKNRLYDGVPDVVIGTEDLLNVKEENVRQIKRILMHPKYKHPAQVHGNDIALVQIDSPWEGTPARLSLTSSGDVPDQNVSPERKVVGGQETRPTIEAMVSGFGLIVGRGEMELFKARNGHEVEAGSSVLRETGLPVVKLSDCKSVHQGSLVSEAQICAGDEVSPKGKKRDSCDGDSGGPLVVHDAANCPYQVGVVSWGPADCGQPKAYGVYTRVSQYASWLESHVPGLKRVVTRPRSATSSIEDSIDELEDLLGGQGRVTVGLSAGNSLKLGTIYRFDVNSDVSGRLILFDVDAQGIVTQIFPNQFTQSGQDRITSGKALALPGPDWGLAGFRAVEPIGRGSLVALVMPETAVPFEGGGAATKQRSKGFAPAESAAGYLLNLVRQTASSVETVKASGGDPSRTFAFGRLNYEIVP